MRRIKAFFKHSHISFKVKERFEYQHRFFYCGRLYAGYIGVYAQLPIVWDKKLEGKHERTLKRLYITIWLFKPEPGCKAQMIKSKTY